MLDFICSVAGREDHVNRGKVLHSDTTEGLILSEEEVVLLLHVLHLGLTFRSDPSVKKNGHAVVQGVQSMCNLKESCVTHVLS